MYNQIYKKEGGGLQNPRYAWRPLVRRIAASTRRT